MALEVAREARRHGIPCAVLAPATPSGVLDAAAAESMPCVRIPARDRRGYLLRLAWWRATHREGLLWCAGLVPAVAALGDRHKVVHLHKLPEGPAQRILTRLARLGARTTLVPSDFRARHVRGADVLPNWTLGSDPISDRDPAQQLSPADRPPTIGYLGRLTTAKGVLDLLAAAETLASTTRPDLRLVLAGEPLFGGDADQVCRALDSAAARRPGQVEQLGRVAPLPEITAFPVVAYETETLTPPFAAGKIVTQEAVADKTAPDRSRPKQPLEIFPIEDLKVVGIIMAGACLLYTSDAADERSSVDLGGCRIIKQKKSIHIACTETS